jgi:hypothetical protein
MPHVRLRVNGSVAPGGKAGATPTRYVGIVFWDASLLDRHYSDTAK